MSNKKTVIFALDVETTGSKHLEHAIISIGAAVGDLDGNLIVKKQFNMLIPEDKCFEKKCYDEFWSKNLHVLEELKKDAKDPKDAMTDFVNFIDALEDEYNLAIITDNPMFDLGFINYYLDFYMNRNPLSYDHNNNYRSVFDTDSYARGAMKMNYDNLWTSDSDVAKTFNINRDNFVEHNHCPMNDAHYIYQMHISLVNALNKQKNVPNVVPKTSTTTVINIGASSPSSFVVGVVFGLLCKYIYNKIW